MEEEKLARIRSYARRIAHAGGRLDVLTKEEAQDFSELLQKRLVELGLFTKEELTEMEDQPQVEPNDYNSKKEKALKNVAEVFEEILDNFHGEENNRIREDIANYTIGYMGVSFGLHVKR